MQLQEIPNGKARNNFWQKSKKYIFTWCLLAFCKICLLANHSQHLLTKQSKGQANICRSTCFGGTSFQEPKWPWKVTHVEIWKAVFRLLHLTTVLKMQWQWSNTELFTDLLSSFKIRLQLLKFISMSCFALIPIIVYKQYVLHLSLAWGPHNCVKCNVNQVKHLVLTRCNIRVIFFQTLRCICLLRVDNFTH